MQIGLITVVAKPVAETRRRERTTKFCDQEGHVPGCRRRGYTSCKFSVQRDIDVNRIAVLVLRLSEFYSPISDMLRTESDGILTAATRIEQQVESQTRFAAERMPLPVLCYLFRRPRMMTVRSVLDLADAQRARR